MCLFGMGTGPGRVGGWVLMASSEIGDERGFTSDEERCGGIGRGRAIVAIIVNVVVGTAPFTSKSG